MADNTQIVVGASLKVDTTQATANVKTFNQEVDKTKSSLKDVGGIADSAGKAVEGAGGNFSKLREQMTALPGPLGAATEGVGKLNVGFKALLANPVVAVIAAIVAALTLLYKAFTNTFEGAEKVEQVFAGIKAAAQALFDNLGHLASALVKFFTFDFSGAVDEIKAVAGAVTDAYNAMSKLTAEAQKLHQEQLKNDLDAAERQKKLAILREQATDEGVSLADRKKALLELRDIAQQNAKEDVDLAKRTAENRIAQLTLEKDGALKNQDEINQIKIKQIQVETDNANELRRIGKQITSADKQEKAERLAAEKEYSDKVKAERQKLADFQNQLTKLLSENELLTIQDQFAKEQKILANKIEDQKKANQKAFEERKITRDQQAQLDAQLDESFHLQRTALIDKHNKELEKKEADFQKEVNDLKQKIMLDGITDQNQAERIKLQIEGEKKLAEAAVRYKDDAEKFQEIKNLINQDIKEQQEKLEEKQRVEEEKKKVDKEKKNAEKILNNPGASFKDKQAAIQQEIDLNQELYDKKLESEEEYTANAAELSNKRKQIDQAELQSKLATANAIGNAFGALSDLVGKQTAAGKAFAVAQATISAITGAVQSFTSLSAIPIVGPALGAIAAATALAAGFENVKKILAVQVPGQGSGGGSVPSAATPTIPAAPIAPKQVSTAISQGSISQLSQATQPVRAYVVEQDNAAAANRAARLEGASRLGG